MWCQSCDSVKFDHTQFKHRHGRNTVPHFCEKNAHVHSQTKFAKLLFFGLADTEWDIVLFTETRYAGGYIALEGGHHMFAPSDPTVAAGMAILVHYMFATLNFHRHLLAGYVLLFVATHMRYSDHDLYRLSWVVMLKHSGTLVFEVTAWHRF